jgi:hypothetical protein
VVLASSATDAQLALSPMLPTHEFIAEDATAIIAAGQSVARDAALARRLCELVSTCFGGAAIGRGETLLVSCWDRRTARSGELFTRIVNLRWLLICLANNRSKHTQLNPIPVMMCGRCGRGNILQVEPDVPVGLRLSVRNASRHNLIHFGSVVDIGGDQRIK